MGKRKRVKIQVQEVEDSEAGGDADDVQLPTPKVPVGPEATVDSSEESSDTQYQLVAVEASLPPEAEMADAFQRACGAVHRAS